MQSQATLAFDKSVEDLSPATPLLPGDRVRYSLTLTAGGDAPLTDVTVTDDVDVNLTATDASASGGSLSGSRITWTQATAPVLSSMNPGDIAVLTFESDIVLGTADGTVVLNQATAQSAAPDRRRAFGR